MFVVMVAMLAQLTGMVAKIGDLSNVAEEIVNAGENARDLAAVLCGDNAGLFLEFEAQPKSVKMEVDGSGVKVESNENGESAVSNVSPVAAAGPTAALIVHCVTSLPLQTTAYVTLTQEIESNAPESHSNFAGRCVNYALWMLKTDMETITKSLDENAEEVLLRIKLIMRYLCMLQKTGVLSREGSTICENILVNMLQVAKDASTDLFLKISFAYLLLSTLPYSSKLNFDNSDLSNEILVFAKNEVLSDVKKLFKPGIGVKAVYLKIEQQEDEDDEGKQLFQIVFRT